MSKIVILFFIAGMIPTAEERAAAESIGATRFRNARLAGDPTDGLEKCDAVAGQVPTRYLGLKGIENLNQKAPAAPKAPPVTAPTPPKAPPAVPKAQVPPAPPATKA